MGAKLAAASTLKLCKAKLTISGHTEMKLMNNEWKRKVNTKMLNCFFKKNISDPRTVLAL